MTFCSHPPRSITKEATHFNVQPPEYWAECFARNGFFRDIDFDASFITPWAVRYRRIPARLEQVVANYERKYWSLIQENRARRDLGIAQKVDLSRTMLELSQTKLEMDEIRSSESWQLLQQLICFRLTAIPLGSRRETLIYMLVRAWRVFRREGVSGIFSRLRSRASWQAVILLLQISYRLKPANVGVEIQVPETNERPPIEPHQETVDIIICVHDALNDVRRCLQSVAEFSSAPCSIIIVDDGSQTDTRDFLVAFARQHSWSLLRNEKAKGYTLAANQGLRQSSADFVIMLNSDTIVTSGWIDRLVACAQSDRKIGLVGPLSNTASWQSIPEYESNGDWAERSSSARSNDCRDGSQRSQKLSAAISWHAFPEWILPADPAGCA